MSAKEVHSDYDGNIEADAVPFGGNYSFQTKAEKPSSDEQGYTYTTNVPGSPRTGVNLNVQNLKGSVNIGGVYNTTIHHGKSMTLFSNVVYNDSSDGSDSGSSKDSDSEPEQHHEIDEKILSSTLNLSLDNKELISENVGRKYLKMARHLKGADFTSVEIENIMKRNTSHGEEEGIFQILERWGEKAPTEATIGNLAAALQKIGRIDLANKLTTDKCDKLND